MAMKKKTTTGTSKSTGSKKTGGSMKPKKPM